jgi:hypothetical protein
VSSEANIVKDLIDSGLRPIHGDLDRFAAGLHAMTAASERPPASAIGALRAARDHAEAARQALLHAPGRIYLIPGGGQAIRGFLYLRDGLSALLRGLTATGATATKELASSRSLLARSNGEFSKADRILGCPYGCRTTTVPAPPTR